MRHATLCLSAVFLLTSEFSLLTSSKSTLDQHFALCVCFQLMTLPITAFIKLFHLLIKMKYFTCHCYFLLSSLGILHLQSKKSPRAPMYQNEIENRQHQRLGNIEKKLRQIDIFLKNISEKFSWNFPM